MPPRKAALAVSSLTVTLTAGLFSQAHAQLLASDSYKTVTSSPNRAGGEYLDRTSLASQGNGTSATIVQGFANTNGGTGTAQFQTTTLGLVNAAVGATSVGSGKVTYSATALDNTNRSTARNLDATPPAASTYYFSTLINRGAISGTLATGRDFVGVGFGNATVPVIGTANLAGLSVGYAGDNGNLVIRARDNATGNVAETILLAASNGNLDNLTLLVVAQVDVNVSGTTDAVTYYVNPTDFTSTSALATTSFLTGSFQANVLATGGDITRLNYFSRNFNSGAFFDEARFGAGGTGVTPGQALGVVAATAPEPATLALLLLGGIALVRRRQ